MIIKVGFIIFIAYCTLCATFIAYFVCSRMLYSLRPLSMQNALGFHYTIRFCLFNFYENVQRSFFFCSFLCFFVYALSYNGVRVYACMALVINVYGLKYNENRNNICRGCRVFRLRVSVEPIVSMCVSGISA